MFVQSLSVNSVARGTPLIFDLPWARHSTFTSVDSLLEYQEKTNAREPNEVTISWWPSYDLAPVLREELEDAGVSTFIVPTNPMPNHPEYMEYFSVAHIMKKLLLALAYDRIVAL
jgi:hypothetical protein